MFYHINPEQEDYLLSTPETGMGFQIIEASSFSSGVVERFIVLNADIAIKLDGNESSYIKRAINEGFFLVKRTAQPNKLIIRKILTEIQFGSLSNQFKNAMKKAAIENGVEKANGDEWFVRFSAYQNDKRVDTVNKKLRTGTYTTMFGDAVKCIAEEENPNERYALPTDLPIKFAFLIEPISNDILQRGYVQKNFGKKGGGREAYFKNGTSPKSLLETYDVDKKEFL